MVNIDNPKDKINRFTIKNLDNNYFFTMICYIPQMLLFVLSELFFPSIK
jgi:hypothetical protein